MDQASSLGRESDRFAAESAGSGDTAAAIGTDERRMHVRAYNYWVSLLKNRAFPAIEDLEPGNLEDFGPHSILLDFTRGSDNPVIAWLGSAIRQECDLAPDLATLADVPGGSLLSRLTDHYLQIIANRAPVGFEAEFVNHRGTNTAYRGILMPFSSDDDTIDFIYGVINWKDLGSFPEEAHPALTPGRPVLALVPADAPAADPLPLDGYEDPAPDETGFDADAAESLYDWLAAAREQAQEAVRADARSRQFLYRALSLAYDFALVADARPDEYAELLEDNGIVAQARAPMTPIVKLVFGVGYDKTRLAEYAIALAHGRRLGVGVGAFQQLLETHTGGLKGLVYAERAERRPAPRLTTAKSDAARDRARALPARAIVEIEGAEEFVVLVARRVDEGHVAVIGALEDDAALVQKALRQLTE